MFWLRACLIALLHVAVAAAVAAAPQGGLGANLLQARAYPMRPCKSCGAARLHSRDQLLAMDDGDLNKMENDLSKEVEDLEKDVDDIKKKNGEELGKLDKRLSDMNTAYKKFGEDTIARTTKFTDTKAKASKDLDASLESTENTHEEIAQLHESMDELRKYLNPYVDKITSGKGWPHGCKCPGAEALLQRLQVSLQLASVDLGNVGDAEEGKRQGEALLRRSAKISKPADMEKYKLVRTVQQLEEKRAKLMQEKTLEITGFGQKQRTALDRIDVAKVKTSLKASTEQKYEESDASLTKVFKTQMDAAGSYLDSAKTQLARLKKNEQASKELFKSFKAELQKCKCL